MDNKCNAHVIYEHVGITEATLHHELTGDDGPGWKAHHLVTFVTGVKDQAALLNGMDWSRSTYEQQELRREQRNYYRGRKLKPVECGTCARFSVVPKSKEGFYGLEATFRETEVQ